MTDSIETVIIRAQQSLEIAGDLNPVLIEIEEDRVLNRFKKYKNILYRLTPLGTLFPASVKNNTEQITCRKLSDVEKGLIKSKIYGLIGITDLKKVNKKINKN